MRKLQCLFTLWPLLAATTASWAGDELRSAPQAVIARAPSVGSFDLFRGFMGEVTTPGELLLFDWSVPSQAGVIPNPSPPGSGHNTSGGLAISPDSSKLFIGEVDGDQVKTLNTGPLTFNPSTLSPGGRPAGLAVGPTGRFLYVAVRLPINALTVIDLTGVLQNQSIPLIARPDRVAVAPNNSYVVVTLNTAVAAVITISTHTLRAYVPLGADSRDVVISPDSKRAVFPIQSLGVVTNVDLATLGKTNWSLPGCGPTSAAFSPAGTRLYVGCLSTNSYEILHGTTGAPIASGGFPTLSGFYQRPVWVSVTPDGKQAWFPGEPFGIIWVLNTTTLAFITNLGGPEHENNKPVFGGPFYELIDPLVSLVSLTGAREVAPAACAPGQIFRVTAKWKNNSAKAWTGVFAEVLALTGGNTLIDQAFAPGVVNPGGVFTGVFRIQLNSCAGFAFQVSLAALDPPINGDRFRSAASSWEQATEPAGQDEAARYEDAAPWTLDPQ